MENLKCIVIDDEAGARNSLINILNSYFNEKVEVIEEAGSAKEGYEKIKSLKPDLIFLDIEMPLENGFQLLNRFRHIDFSVVFVTAYDHYAIKAIKFSALDYILKPVDIDELEVTIDKFIRLKEKQEERDKKFEVLKENMQAEEKKKKIGIPDTAGMMFVELNEIIRCESDANYTKIFLQSGKRVIASRTLGDYEEMFKEDEFYRIHRSHLINLNHISRFSKSDGGFVVMDDGSEVEISRRKKKGFLERIGR